jgi:hypothetical protein
MPQPISLFAVMKWLRHSDRMLYPINAHGIVRRHLTGAFAGDPTIPERPSRPRRALRYLIDTARPPRRLRETALESRAAGRRAVCRQYQLDR